ncbi:SDR family NAD(P)-dependent oxidoreductase [Sphingomonas oryzagri]|uniref:SDR family NAD(P)-dependent oxidoreductase n=1 Tax=Sphingomonas oryzagri TaxID=3042314 RepID=A0ABT6MYP2_9SPHN|nr:SDR family NAD(P)-dependent oxidoreductase [Sphingomonas oryzagri]MDH7637948.1 SDR family NAD(P)-dependent oxidoreductase [Sphingomonas oryzagri]
MTDKPLAGQLALVTGASRGIGAATAEALAAAGAHVVLTARTSGGLEELEERIHAAGGSATIAPMDLTESDSIARLATAIGGRWDALDILVLNAGLLGDLAPVPSIDGKRFNQLLTLNVLANQAMLANFDQMLRRSERGRVVAITSTVARQPRAYWGAYGASKAALENLVLAYGDEVVNLSTIRVAIVNPGATATRMRADAYPGEDPATIQQPADAGAKIARLIVDDYEPGLVTSLTA